MKKEVTTTIAPKLIRACLSNKCWLESENSGQLTPKFRLINEYRKDGFILYFTSVGHFLCHVLRTDIIFQDSEPKGDVYIEKVDEHLYKLVYYAYSWRVMLFTELGEKITEEYTCVRNMSNGLVATENCGKYGFIDGNAKVIVPFKYKSVEDFNEYGYAIVEYSNKSITVIDKSGKELFKPISAYNISFLTSSLIKVEMLKANIGVIDISGREIVPCNYTSVRENDGYIIVKYSNKYGLYSIDGKVELECIYPEIIETPTKFVVKDFDKIEIPKHKEVIK